jgi:hypothetical protein
VDLADSDRSDSIGDGADSAEDRAEEGDESWEHDGDDAAVPTPTRAAGQAQTLTIATTDDAKVTWLKITQEDRATYNCVSYPKAARGRLPLLFLPRLLCYGAALPLTALEGTRACAICKSAFDCARQNELTTVASTVPADLYMHVSLDGSVGDSQPVLGGFVCPKHDGHACCAACIVQQSVGDGSSWPVFCPIPVDPSIEPSDGKRSTGQ